MTLNPPPHSQEICQKLLRGYQFSSSDLESTKNEVLYTTLDKYFDSFQHYLSVVGFTLLKDDDVIFLEKENKVLNNEEKQTIVILFLLTDLWMEKGKAYNDLFVLYNPWTELDWFRDGYGKEYLHQVGLEENDLAIIEDIFKKLERKGIVSYRVDTQTILLRRPAERIINLARKIYNQMKAKDSSGDE